MTMPTGRSRTASLPANEVARGKPEPIVTALQLPLTVVESDPFVSNVASLPVENSNPYINRKRPSRPFRPAPFIPQPPPHSAQDIPRPFGGYTGFHGLAAPRPFSYNNTPVSTMEYSQSFPRPSLPPPGLPQDLVFQYPDHLLHSKIVTQIDYYFSYDNLVKDTYLRQNMDDHGWVSIELIANFNRVRQLTNNIPMILYALQTSSVVEVWGHKIRRRNDWKRWILSAKIVFPKGRFSNDEWERVQNIPMK